ncbi:unnamed protein product [Calypogeia fissa]
MASLASGRGNAHHRLIANSSRRRLRHFAAAVMSSVSSQLPSDCSLVGPEEQQDFQGTKKNKNSRTAAEEVSRPIAGPFSSSGDDNSECFSESLVRDLDYCSSFYSDEASSERRLSLWPPISLWMSSRIMDESRNPSTRNSPPNVFSVSSNICQSRLRVNRFLRDPIWQIRRELQNGHSRRHHGGVGDEKSGRIMHEGRTEPFPLRQFHGSGLFSSSWGSRQCMQSSRGFSLQQEHKLVTEHGRRHVEEFSRVRIWYNPRRSHMGHAHHHHDGGGNDKSGEESERILRLGLWSDVALAIGKGGAGYVSGSTALIADAAHSVSDVALSAVALWTTKVAHAPKDKQHPYGHGKFESVGALGISFMLLMTGGGIAWHALESLQPYIPMISEWVQTTTGHSHDHVHGGGHHHGIDLQHPYVALSAAIVSIGVKETLYQLTKKVGEEKHSELLKASAWHHRSDAVSSIVALVGIGGSIMGMPLLDPVAGFVVSGMIMKAGFETGYQSLQDLVDSGVPESVLAPIRETVLQVEGVEGCHHLRGRKMGSFIHLDVHIEVDPWLSVSAAHNIAEAVRHQVQRKHPEVAETFVHIEPADGRTKILTHREAEIEHELHDLHNHPGKNEYAFNKKDLTNLGSKSDLMESGSHQEKCVDDGLEADMRQHSGVEQDVRNVVEANFQEKMSVNQLTSHFVQGKVVVEVEVSMSPEMSIRNAMDYADEVQRAILERVSDICSVRVQLKLSKSSTENP